MRALLGLIIWFALIHFHAEAGHSVVGAFGDRAPIALAVTPRGVVLFDESWEQRLVPGTAGARGACFTPGNGAVVVAGPAAVRTTGFGGSPGRLHTDGWEMVESPVYSPDGETLAIAGYTRAAGWAVYTLRGRNANPVFVAKGRMPAWMPDSRTLLFENYTDDSAQVYVHDPDTRGVERLRYGAPIGTAVGPSVDTRGAVSFASPEGLWVKEPDGDRARRLTDGSAMDGHAAVSPDGKKLLFIRATRDEALGPREHRIMVLGLDRGDESVPVCVYEGEAAMVAWSRPAGPPPAGGPGLPPPTE